MKKILSIALLLNCLIVVGQNSLNIVPVPTEVKMGKGIFTIDRSTTIVLEGSGLEKSAAFFNDFLQQQSGYKLKITKNYAGANAIRLNYERLDNEIAGAYNLTIDNKGVYLAGDNETGVFYGIQTIIQLLPKTKTEKRTTSNERQLIPYLTIKDHPRFQYRGMHLDVGRHFFPVSFIKKYIDYLAAYKYNIFHWHLTEDQGWRIEIKKYPELTKVGAWRNGSIIGRYPGKGSDNKYYGGFYTQDEIKDVVQYAAARYIDVIPEIEMPGHSSAAIAAYPWLSCFPAKPTEIPANMISQKSIDEQKNGRIKLVQETWGVFDDVFCAGKDSTFKFLENVIDEVITLFPSKYFHIGGDESPKTHWKKCPACQKRMKDNNLKDEHELQSWFVQRIEKYLNSKGRKIIGWDEILEGGLAPNATVMSWRGEEGGIEAAKQNHDVIMTPGSHCYLDHSQSKNEDSVTIGGYLPLDKVYSYEPVPAVLNVVQAKHVLGAQGNVWTEYIGNTSKVEYMIFPRMIALSEVLWSPAAKRDWKDFERRLPTILERLDDQKINYSRAYYDLKATVMPTEDYEGVLWKLESKNPKDRICISSAIGTGDVLMMESPASIPVKNNSHLNALICQEGPIKSYISQKFFFNKATGKKITLVNEPSKNYPGDGAFTLVNAVQNEKGLSRSNEFLGFLGKDLDAMIDLGTLTDINKITLHVLDQNGSWIYLPSQVEITYLPDYDLTDEIIKKSPKEIKTIDPVKDKGAKTITIESKQKCRFLHIVAKNLGTIPSGNPGAGNPAWLFVDEIEIE
ncbi:MAG: beta-N-acetylhexosaminidase [Ferruginibacter sp.]